MQTASKVGEVKRTPFGALKRMCEEFSTTMVLSR